MGGGGPPAPPPPTASKAPEVSKAQSIDEGTTTTAADSDQTDRRVRRPTGPGSSLLDDETPGSSILGG